MTKDNILPAVLCFCCSRADCLESKVTSDRKISIYSFWIPACFEASFKLQGTLRMLFLNSYCFAFEKASFYPWRVARGKMGILKGFRRLVVSFNV